MHCTAAPVLLQRSYCAHAALELTRSMAVVVMYWPTPDPAVATGTRDQILHSHREVREHLKLPIEKRLKGSG